MVPIAHTIQDKESLVKAVTYIDRRKVVKGITHIKIDFNISLEARLGIFPYLTYVCLCNRIKEDTIKNTADH